MREDQHAERPRRLDEAGGGDRLAGRRRVAEPVAPDRARIGACVLLDRLLVVERVLGGLLLGLLLVIGTASIAAPLPFACLSWEAISSVSIPASASTWWRRSSVPEARCGRSSASTRSSPSIRP